MNSSASPARRIASNLLWTPRGVLPNPIVTLADDGTILAVDTLHEPDRSPSTEFYAGMLVPGLVNAHCHLELSYMKGLIPEACGFVGFAQALHAARRHFSEPGRLRAIAAADAAMWQTGIAGVGDISNGASTFSTKLQSTIRYRSFVEVFGLHITSAEELSARYRSTGIRSTSASTCELYTTALPDATADCLPLEDTSSTYTPPIQSTNDSSPTLPVADSESARHHKTSPTASDDLSVNNLAYSSLLDFPLTSLTPHALYSVQDAPFRAIAAEGDAPLSIHFMESPAEAELFERRGPLWEWYKEQGYSCDFLHYGSPAQRLVASVPPNRSIILVHNCCVTQRDIDLVMNHFTAPVWWCLCPRSNRYISRLQPPVELLRRDGLNICLGTDSLASNHDLSLVEEMRMFPEVPLPELLGWATLNGAQALGLDDELGEIAPGKRCGLVVVSGLDYATMRLTPATRIRRLI